MNFSRSRDTLQKESKLNKQPGKVSKEKQHKYDCQGKEVVKSKGSDPRGVCRRRKAISDIRNARYTSGLNQCQGTGCVQQDWICLQCRNTYRCQLGLYQPCLIKDPGSKSSQNVKHSSSLIQHQGIHKGAELSKDHKSSILGLKILQAQKIHVPKKMYKCGRCATILRKKSDVVQHMKIHMEKLFYLLE